MIGYNLGFPDMSINIAAVKDALRLANIEVYRTAGAEIQIAERIRYHIMDSGVRIGLATNPSITFSGRAQKSDFPHATADTLFARIRETIGQLALARGFLETETRTVNITDPVDDAKMLDVFFEVVFKKEFQDMASLIDEVKWAVSLDKVAS